jgi:hypothetical protein
VSVQPVGVIDIPPASPYASTCSGHDERVAHREVVAPGHACCQAVGREAEQGALFGGCDAAAIKWVAANLPAVNVIDRAVALGDVDEGVREDTGPVRPSVAAYTAPPPEEVGYLVDLAATSKLTKSEWFLKWATFRLPNAGAAADALYGLVAGMR